jgi:hypothetical protein
MRTGLLATALAVLLAPALAPAADPAVTFQTQPLGRLLDDLRTFVHSVGGEPAVTDLNKGIQRSIGEKGFDGLDITRPIVGYVDLTADPTDSVAVVVFPVTGEKEWLDFCERWNKSKPKALKDGLYEVPPPLPGLKAAMWISEGYAHVATGMKDPARVLDAKTLVPVAKLYDPTDASLMTGKVYLDRIPKELRALAKQELNQLQRMAGGGPGGPGGAVRLGAMEMIFVEPFLKLAPRALVLSEQAKEAVLRVNADALSGGAELELTVTPKPGSELEKRVAAIKPTQNRFAGLVTPDTVAGGRGSFPLFDEQVRAGWADSLEKLRKEAANNAFPPMKPLIDELLKGLIRTAKAGDADIAAAMRGPAKDGTYTAVGAVTFDDPSGVEKELKKFINANAGADFMQALKWDAEKVGGVSIHTIDLGRDNDRELKALFGQSVAVAFAFAPKAVYGAVGPGDEAVKAVKGAMALKPAPAPAFEAVLNPDRLVRMVTTMQPRAGGEVQRMFGKDDKLGPIVFADATGGKELKVKLGVNLKLFAGFWVTRAVGGAAAPAAPLAK